MKFIVAIYLVFISILSCIHLIFTLMLIFKQKSIICLSHQKFQALALLGMTLSFIGGGMYSLIQGIFWIDRIIKVLFAFAAIKQLPIGACQVYWTITFIVHFINEIKHKSYTIDIPSHPAYVDLLVILIMLLLMIGYVFAFYLLSRLTLFENNMH